jgi:hypothetical protein
VPDEESQEDENLSGFIVSRVTQIALHASLFPFLLLSENKDHFCIASGKL